jgi:hypothetical protein
MRSCATTLKFNKPMTTELLRPIPPLIDKKLSKFVPGVLRVTQPSVPLVTLKAEPARVFSDLAIGQTFQMLSQDIKTGERQLLLRKTAPGGMDINAVVVVTYNNRDNPVGQQWTVEAACPVAPSP